jgi:hypothetical protein
MTERNYGREAAEERWKRDGWSSYLLTDEEQARIEIANRAVELYRADEAQRLAEERAKAFSDAIAHLKDAWDNGEVDDYGEAIDDLELLAAAERAKVQK